MEYQTDIIKTESFSMKYLRFGRGRKTFVMIPGLSVKSVLADAGVVAKAYSCFAEEYTVYLFDRREDLPEKYSVRDMARDTAAAIRAAGLSDIRLFGVSQGGMIAECIAAENPGLPSALILGSTACRVRDSRVIDKWIGLAEKGDRKGLSLDFGEKVYPRGFFEKYREVFTRLSNAITDEELRRFVILAEGTKGFDVSGELEKIACPTLVLGAKDDAVLGGAASEEIVGRLTNAAKVETYMYEGYGHAAYDTAPDYKERIMRFLSASEKTVRR